MNLEMINKFLKRKPFLPFEVVLSSGETYRITHPEIAVANKGGLVIAYPDLETIDVCSLLHITAVHFLPTGQATEAQNTN